MKKLFAIFLLCLLPMATAEEECTIKPPVCFGVDGTTATIDDIDGIDVDTRNKDGYTPLHWAAGNNTNLEIISALVNAGADVNAQAIFDKAPIHLAASNVNPEIISGLVSAGVDVNAQSKFGNAPLHLAAWFSNYPKIIEILLKAGSNPKIKNKKGETAYDLIQKNKELKDTSAYWKLHDLSFE